MLNLETFFSEGYVKHLDSNIDVSQYEDYNFPDCTDNEIFEKTKQSDVERFACQHHLLELHEYLGQEYVSKLFNEYEIKERDLWDGVDHRSRVWHNDHEQGDPFNSTFLVYIDEQTEENGNFIAVRGPNSEKYEYPKRGEFMWLNQKEMFQHKANHQSGLRRLVGFEFYIPALL